MSFRIIQLFIFLKLPLRTVLLMHISARKGGQDGTFAPDGVLIDIPILDIFGFWCLFYDNF